MARNQDIPQIQGIGDVVPVTELGVFNYDVKDLLKVPMAILDYEIKMSTVNDGIYVRFRAKNLLNGEVFQCSSSHELIVGAFQRLQPEQLPLGAQVYLQGKSYYLANPKL